MILVHTRTLAIAAASLATATATAQDAILLFQADDQGHLAAGLDAVGITPSQVIFGNFPALTAALQDPATTVAFISNPCCFFEGGTPGALADFVARGNAAHMSFWNMSAEPLLQDVFGIDSMLDFSVPRPVHDNIDHRSWLYVETPVLPARPSGSRSGSELVPQTGATVVGTFDTVGGPGAIVVANEGRSLLNGFAYDPMESDGIRQLIGAQAEFILGFGPPCYADYDLDGQLTIFDFLGFQSDFATGRRKADCDGDREFTLFDFFCFQNLFDAGCP